jgi:hypothetical protein
MVASASAHNRSLASWLRSRLLSGLGFHGDGQAFLAASVQTKSTSGKDSESSVTSPATPTERLRLLIEAASSFPDAKVQSGLCDALEAFLAEIYDHQAESTDVLQQALSRPKLAAEVRRLKKQCNELMTETCNLLYILDRQSRRLDLHDEWLRSRIDHLLTTRTALERECAALRDAV